MIEGYPWGATAFDRRKGYARLQHFYWRRALNLDNLKKQAKLLVRWHREGNYSIGGRIRNLPRYRNLTDVEALALKFPLGEAQEIIALEAGYTSWAELKTAVPVALKRAKPAPAAPRIKSVKPVMYVTNVQASAVFFRDKLGFTIDFLHGNPPFYGSVSRGGACLHLRFVHEPVFKDEVREKEQLLSAFVDVDHIKSLFAEFKATGVAFAQPLRKEPWGSSAFIVRDPDGNRICFAG
jgi:catechol 2,3-dioxygenase-like lactoylglutathione lyase family enzyme